MANNTDTTWMSAPLPRRTLSLGLLYQGREYSLTPTDTPFVIGRDADSNDLCVRSQYSSRTHCTIEFREAKFVLCDSSTNGTYLQLGRAENLRLHHETTPLIGHGCFKPGQNFSADDPDLIHFVIRDTVA